MFREPLFHGKEIYHSIVQRWEDLHFFTSKAATPCPMSPWKPGKASRFNCEKKPGSLGYIGKNLYFVLPFFFSFQRAILFPWQSWESLKRSSSRIYIYIYTYFSDFLCGPFILVKWLFAQMLRCHLMHGFQFLSGQAWRSWKLSGGTFCFWEILRIVQGQAIVAIVLRKKKKRHPRSFWSS